MKTALICSAERSEVPLLSLETPLAAAPALGYGLVEYWMSHLACSGVKEVVVLANDRPEALEKIVGNGSRWGISAKVMSENMELSREQASEKFEAEATIMDHFPGMPDVPVFDSYAHWFKALQAWMPHAMTPDRVGMREISPGVWVGRHGHIADEATLCAPCWLGNHVYVGPGALIGPGTVLENGAFVEPKAEIKNSVVGPATFVGQFVQITNSLVWGNTVLNWETGQQEIVTDAFLLCSLQSGRMGSKTIPWLDRIAEWLPLKGSLKMARASVPAVAPALAEKS